MAVDRRRCTVPFGYLLAPVGGNGRLGTKPRQGKVLAGRGKVLDASLSVMSLTLSITAMGSCCCRQHGRQRVLDLDPLLCQPRVPLARAMALGRGGGSPRGDPHMYT